LKWPSEEAKAEKRRKIPGIPEEGRKEERRKKRRRKKRRRKRPTQTVGQFNQIHKGRNFRRKTQWPEVNNQRWTPRWTPSSLRHLWEICRRYSFLYPRRTNSRRIWQRLNWLDCREYNSKSESKDQRRNREEYLVFLQ